MDHDQRLKTLLRTFFADFFELFFPELAATFDFTTVEFLETEVFPDPPEGKRRNLDIVARLHTTDPVTDEVGRSANSWISLIHIEIESADSAQPLRRRMHKYYTHLKDKYDLPVLPVALYLHVALDGLGFDEHKEWYGALWLLHFRWLYVGLPGLDAVEYLQRSVVLAAALSALMRVPSDRRAWLASEAKQRIAAADLDEQRTFLLLECLETYLDLTAEEEAEVQEFLKHDEYREARNMVMTTFEKGIEKGIEKGRLEGEACGFRKALAALLEDRFGQLPQTTLSRLQMLNEQELSDLIRRAAHAHSLAELGLNGQN